jgi:hypothetical protein
VFAIAFTLGKVSSSFAIAHNPCGWFMKYLRNHKMRKLCGIVAMLALKEKLKYFDINSFVWCAARACANQQVVEVESSLSLLTEKIPTSATVYA